MLLYSIGGGLRSVPGVHNEHQGAMKAEGQARPVLNPWWRIMGHEKSENALKMGRFGTKSGSNGSKTHFSKSAPRPLGMLIQLFSARFEPLVARFGPWKIAKCLRNGPCWNHKWVKNGSKTCFSKVDPTLGPTVCGLGYPVAPPSDHRYRGLGVWLGEFEAWKPQKRGGCGWTR